MTLRSKSVCILCQEKGPRQAIPLSEISASEDEKGRKATNTMASTSPKLSSMENLASKTCGPDGTCCCTQTIEDEGNAASQHECHYNNTAPAILTSEPDSATTSLADSKSSAKSSSPLAATEAEKPPRHSTLHPSITLLTGRPRPKKIIRAFLEQALGESAVVVCGPKGLREEVRRSVVSLSDERAVHKGGAGCVSA